MILKVGELPGQCQHHDYHIILVPAWYRTDLSTTETKLEPALFGDRKAIPLVVAALLRQSGELE